MGMTLNRSYYKYDLMMVGAGLTLNMSLLFIRNNNY
jgi:hypothetical protein